MPHDAQHLGVDALGVVIEVDRVDVLVLLRRVLGVADGAVGQLREPVGVLGDPRVVGGGLQREVEGDLDAERVGATHEGAEVGERAEVGVHGVVAACTAVAHGPPIAHGEPGSFGPGFSVLFGPLRLVTPMGWIGGR